MAYSSPLTSINIIKLIICLSIWANIYAHADSQNFCQVKKIIYKNEKCPSPKEIDPIVEYSKQEKNEWRFSFEVYASKFIFYRYTINSINYSINII
jgi:hypothetical protein